MANKLRLPRYLMLVLFIIFLTPGFVSADNITVVASDQDYDIAKLVSASLNAELVVTQWGMIRVEDVERIIDDNPEKLVIIGGPYAVPSSVEALGIGYERVGGGNRIETARLSLKRFFQVRTRSYVLPSEDVVREYLLGSRGKSAVFLIGNSTVSERWGRYYAVKLGDYFKDTTVLTVGAGDVKPPTGTQTVVAVGNADNNPFVSQRWPTSLPPELTYFPLVYLKHEGNRDILFIVGSDQNIFFTQRTLESMGLKKLRPRDLLVFLLLASLLFALVHRSSKSWLALPVLIATGVVFILSELRRIPQSELSWDSLYVYFDGALALSFIDGYETILSGRSSPGTSYLTYLYFLPTSPTDINAIMLTMLMALTVLLLSYIIGMDLMNRRNGIAIMFILYANPYFRDRIPIYASEMPFAAFTLLALIALSVRSTRRAALGGILIALSSVIRPSGLLLYPATVSYLMYHKQMREATTITVALGLSLLALQILAPTMGVLSAYSTEMSVKGQYQFNPLELVGNLNEVLRHFVLILGVSLAPGLFIRKYTGRFDGMASLYVLLHLVGMVFWVDVSARYVFPVIPMATIITVTHINDLQNQILRRGLLLGAIVINLYMSITGYRFPSVI